MRTTPALLAIALATTAAAQPVFTGGAQRSRGRIATDAFKSITMTQTYDISAPDPTASWSPPQQSLLLGKNYPNATHVFLETTWTSTITPTRASLDVSTRQDQRPTQAWFTSIDYDHLFELRFTVTETTPAVLRAEFYREHFLYTRPIRLTLGRVGQAPVVDLTYERPMSPFNPQAFFYNPTQHLLAPGDYLLRYTDSSVSGFHLSSTGVTGADDRSFFTLDIPAPGALAALLIAPLGAARRRRAPSPSSAGR